MKKVKPKKKQGMIENTEPRLAVIESGKEGAVSIATKTKDKDKDKLNLKKPGLKEEPEEGLAARWLGKIQWLGLVKDFLREVRIELKKVTWPSRKETIAATAMVILLSVVVAFFLGLLDVGLAKAVGIILKR
jgi:preprotein translocase subunit SecE